VSGERVFHLRRRSEQRLAKGAKKKVRSQREFNPVKKQRRRGSNARSSSGGDGGVRKRRSRFLRCKRRKDHGHNSGVTPVSLLTGATIGVEEDFGTCFSVCVI
ncbi:hypothetical protein U1Q18_020725, partial [Sarracenia purpurea var. burkii]